MIESGIIAPGHGREVVGSLDDTGKSSILHLMDAIQLPSSERFVTQITVHTETKNYDVS